MNIIQGIKGFLGTSLIEYPGKVAAVVFLSGCNLRCPYCHNMTLLNPDPTLEDLALEEIIEALERRRKLLDGVVVTGGEPTIHPQIGYLLRSLRTTGLAIKLDTNGLHTNVLAAMAGEGLIDYVAMDVKLQPQRYPQELQAPRDAAQRLAMSVDFLRSSGLEYEFRTTCVPGLVQDEDIQSIGRLIEGAPVYCLQQYRPVENAPGGLDSRPPYPREVLERFSGIAQAFVKRVEVRYA